MFALSSLPSQCRLTDLDLDDVERDAGVEGFGDAACSPLAHGLRDEFTRHAALGWVLHQQGRKIDAISAYQAAIAQEPENWWASYHSGYMFFDAQQFERAEPYLAKVLAKRNIPDVARDVATIQKIRALTRARVGATKKWRPAVDPPESVTDADIVVWYTGSLHHIPRDEDDGGTQLMSVGFTLMPFNLFDASPLHP